MPQSREPTEINAPQPKLEFGRMQKAFKSVSDLIRSSWFFGRLRSNQGWTEQVAPSDSGAEEFFKGFSKVLRRFSEDSSYYEGSPPRVLRRFFEGSSYYEGSPPKILRITYYKLRRCSVLRGSVAQEQWKALVLQSCSASPLCRKPTKPNGTQRTSSETQVPSDAKNIQQCLRCE